MKIRFHGKIVLVAASVAILATACGSSSGSSTTASSSSTTSASGGSTADAAAALATYTNTAGLQYAKPDAPFAVGSHKVAIISCGQTGIGCQQMSAFAQEAAKAAGWTASPTLDGKFDPNQQAAYVQQALNQGYDAIILASIDAKSISAAIDAAVAKKVPVACIMCENPDFAGKVIDTTTGGYPGGYALSTWMAVTVQGKGNIVGFDDKSFPIVGTRMKGIQEGLAKYCPACTFSVQQFPTTDLAKPGPPTWTGFLAANPPGKVQIVAGPYDFMSLPAAKTSAQAGRTDPLLTGFDAYSEFVKAIGAGDPPTAGATVAAPFEYCSWAAMDEVARVVAGQPTWDASKLPVAVVDKDNASQFSDGYLKTPFSTPDYFKTQWTK
jgi:ABC-type sugar transport system substrate-binding protein